MLSLLTVVAVSDNWPPICTEGFLSYLKYLVDCETEMENRVSLIRLSGQEATKKRDMYSFLLSKRREIFAEVGDIPTGLDVKEVLDAMKSDEYQMYNELVKYEIVAEDWDNELNHAVTKLQDMNERKEKIRGDMVVAIEKGKADLESVFVKELSGRKDVKKAMDDLDKKVSEANLWVDAVVVWRPDGIVTPPPADEASTNAFEKKITELIAEFVTSTSSVKDMSDKERERIQSFIGKAAFSAGVFGAFKLKRILKFSFLKYVVYMQTQLSNQWEAQSAKLIEVDKRLREMGECIARINKISPKEVL